MGGTHVTLLRNLGLIVKPSSPFTSSKISIITPTPPLPKLAASVSASKLNTLTASLSAFLLAFFFSSVFSSSSKA